MAKKIRLDFSKTEERSGWNTRAIPEGIQKMKIDAVQITEANDGTPMWIYALVPADSRYKSRRFPYYCKIQPNQLWKLRDLLVAAGITVPKKAVSIDPEAPVGAFIAAEVEDETNAQYAGRSVIQGTYGLDILDEDGSIAGDDDEDTEDDESEDEEYEADEAEDDEAEDDEEAEEEDDEDDEEEDLDALSLAELRKRAKGLGIDTAGVKKAELIEAILEEESDEDDEEDDDEEELDEDDLGDEELEDDEDEEEEPAPAPKRKKAAPAPAAKKAPAKRVIKRR